ncbi:MAG: Hpt domain-containing protein [Pseudomonadota bacterium]
MSNTDFPNAAQFDTGPLSWVMVEIREALGRSKTALFEAGGREPEDQATSLQHAKSHLHQAHGALQMVDVDGVVLITQVAEEALDRFKAGTLKCTTDHAQTLANLYQALVEYLEELLGGAPSQPVRLFPYYRAVQEMLGAERIHPADLFFPDLSQQARLPAPEGSGTAPDYPAYRQRFERALLPYLKSADKEAQLAQAGALRDAVAQVADAQQDAPARTFWLAQQAFAELVAAGQLDSGLYVKQLFGLINLQMRRLTQGNAALPDAMLREALFFIAGPGPASGAAGDDVSALVNHLRGVFALDGMAPGDYETRRYGKIDPEALARARQGMAEAKAAWQRLADAAIDPALDAAFGQALSQVAAACDKLGLEALSTLVRQLAAVAEAAVTAGRSEALSLEMTTAVLFAEHGLEQIRHLPDDFAAHADTIGARLQALLAGESAPEPAQWQGGIARQMQQDDTVVALALEMKAELRQVEKVLDDYYGDPSKRPALQELDAVLHQLQGALAILDQDDAMQAALHVKAQVRELAAGQGDPAQEPKTLDEIAQNVGALGFFVDMLAQNAAGARERFAFDAAHGTFRAVPFKKLAAAAPVPLLEEEMPAPAAPEPEVAAQAAPEAGDAAVEAELLEIFISEAQEVLIFVHETLRKPNAHAGSADNLTMLRRSFHTLKGSGRMVGLNQFADAAASIEKVMNVWLAESRPANDELFALLTRAERDLSAWVDELIADGVSARNADALSAAAARVQEGGAFDMADADEAAEAVAADVPDVDGAVDGDNVIEAIDVIDMPAETVVVDTVAETEIEAETVVGVEAGIEAETGGETEPDAETLAQTFAEHGAEIGAGSEAETGAESIAGMDGAADADTGIEAHDESGTDDTGFPVAEPTLAHASGNVIDFPSGAALQPPPEDDNVKHIGALSIPLPLYNIYLAETDELVRLLTRDFGEWRHEPRRPVTGEALHAAHTLTGTSGTVGFKVLRDLALVLEQTLQGLQPPAPQLEQAQHDLLDFTIERVRQMLQSFALGDMPPAQPELIAALEKLREELAAPRGPGSEFDARLESLFADTFNSIVSDTDDAAKSDVADDSVDVAHADGSAAAQTAVGGSPAADIELPEDASLEDRLDALFAATYHSLMSGPPPVSDFASRPALDVPATTPSKKAPSANDDIDDLFDSVFDATPPKKAPPTVNDDIDDLFDSVFNEAPPKKAPPTVNDDIDNLFDSAFDDAFAAPLSQIDAPAVVDSAAEAELLAFAAPEPEAAPKLELVRALEDEPAAEPTPELEAELAKPELEPEPELEAASELESETTQEPEPVSELESEAKQEPESEPEPEPEEDAALAAEAEQHLQSLQELEPEPQASVAALEPSEADAMLVPAVPEPPQAEPEPDVRVVMLPDAPAELAAVAPASYTDELDPDLLPVFLEEGADLLPQIGQALRAWQRNPADFSHANLLQRVLHTAKGSARMAGAMRLGQHAHEIETHIENMVHAGSATPQAFEELLAHYDHALLLFEHLQHPAEPQPEQPAAPDAAAATVAEARVEDSAPAPSATAVGDSDNTGGAAKAPLVRVRADILDRLVNQAGEISISRSKLENEVGTLRSSLSEFSENLGRLRRQLREIEMQAESQIASRMAISSEREFDPLEFDRFTRLQELTRMMAESVNDVASFHESLARSVDSASGDLGQQARMTRDLQRDLMRVRMVPFASISERLFRVARQSAKEVDKRVNLDIRGGSVDIDRSVLERMAAPFEHLLRNAIVHGVETRAQRASAGKNETGELLVQVSQQGNEVVLEFSDDGAGLDLQRIRAKARSVGLLLEGEDISDSEAAELIFEAGFSTADALTELAGRGVGMDIVRSEAQALGGRVDIASESGKGARFTIHLPLTLAVTQVVLLVANGKTYALPSTLVEQVLQMKEGALGEARTRGHVLLQGQPAPLHYLPAMLGEAGAQPAQQRSSPVLMLRNGNERLALHVDDVLGNREVVIKNIGPQLARMAGIAGATVLGSGEIVLILNPVALAQHLAHHPELRARSQAVAGSAPAAQPSSRVIMVVDDSLTVRRVTQRLLEREGYQVVLAKDGVDALEQMQDRLPDLMLVDIEMPRMDGFDLTRNVRGDEKSRDIPIIMITSRSADKHRNYAMQLGVNAYFGKPFQEPVLVGAIAGLLAEVPAAVGK